MVPGETLSSINETYGKTMGYIRSGTFGMKEFLDGMSVKNPEHRHNRVTNEHLYWAFMNSLAGSTGELNLLAGLGNLSMKTGSETGFLARNLDRLLDRDFRGRISDRKAKQVFKAETGF